MSFFSPVPTVDQRQRQPPPPPPRPAGDGFRPYLAAGLVLVILVLLAANLLRLGNRATDGRLAEEFALRMDSLDAALQDIESKLTGVQESAEREASALATLTGRVTALESRHAHDDEKPAPESRPAAPVAAAPAAAAPAAAAPAAKPRPAAKKKAAASSRPAASPSQIPASAPSVAWIGCPRQVCTRSGDRATLRNVTPVWASPYSGERVAVLGAGTYTVVSDEDVGGYPWLQVRLK